MTKSEFLDALLRLLDPRTSDGGKQEIIDQLSLGNRTAMLEVLAIFVGEYVRLHADVRGQSIEQYMGEVVRVFRSRIDTILEEVTDDQ